MRARGTTGPWALNERVVIARRAAEELREDAILNYGFGIPDAVAKLVAARGRVDDYYQTIEHGTYGGTLVDGELFGFARHPRAMIDSTSQFDFCSGGGRLRVERFGAVRKFVDRVAQITFSGVEAVRSGQDALYVTERAVFRLTPKGLVLDEVAPGVDVRADVLERMGFAPLIPLEPRRMDPAFFREEQ